MTLDQLMAFTVNPDHARQEQVWEALQRSPTREAYQIRRMLTEGAVRASDKRAQFVGIDDYEAAGGIVLRDLFESDDGGWLQDPALLDRLVAEKLEREAEAVRAEGWKWVEVAPDFPYGHTYGLRRLSGKEVPLSEEETAARDALKAELDKLEETVRRRRGDPRGGRRAARRDRDGAGGVRGAARPLRCGRDRACRCLRQHRHRRRACTSSAAMCGPRTRRRVAAEDEQDGATPRPAAPRSRAPRRRSADDPAAGQIPAARSRTRTRASGRCPIG